MNNINMFTDNDECVEFLVDMQNEKICMIISGALAEQIVPCIHDLAQVEYNTSFSVANKNYITNNWSKNWSKIKSVYTAISPICEALNQTAKQCEQDAISHQHDGRNWGGIQQEIGSIRTIVHVYTDHERDLVDDQIRRKTHQRIH